jgi:hypothetical protein
LGSEAALAGKRREEIGSDAIRVSNHKSYEKNKEKTKQQGREYNKVHKDERRVYMTNYMNTIRKAKRATKLKCETCHIEICRGHVTAHNKTKTHLAKLNVSAESK